jgi:hypothetical protein
MFFVLAWCIFERKVQNERNMPNKRIFVSEKSGCDGTNADLHMEEEVLTRNTISPAESEPSFH